MPKLTLDITMSLDAFIAWATITHLRYRVRLEGR
jgi:hypothetical protein